MTTSLTLRPASECRYDAVSLGEVMLRLDPGEGRIRTARAFRAWEGGGEYNVARGLSRVFGLRTAAVTGLVDDEVGRLVEADGVVAALGGRTEGDRVGHVGSSQTDAAATAWAVSRWMVSKSRAARSWGLTIHEPPTAGTLGRAR